MALRLNRDGSLKLSENDIEDQILDFLRAEGFLPIRLHAGTVQLASGEHLALGEKGRPDWLFVRPAPFLPEPSMTAFFLEAKSPTGRLRPAQKIWIENARSYGYTVLVINDIDDIRAFVREKCRRNH